MPEYTKTGHQIGATYFCHYWRNFYTVLGPSDIYEGKGVKVRGDDGGIREHLTPVGEDLPINCFCHKCGGIKHAPKG